MSTIVTLVGNLTRDFEAKVLPSGSTVANGSLAVTERRLNKSTNEWEDGETSFYDVEIYNGQGENAVNSLGKGNRVIVVGRLRIRDFERQDGSKGKQAVVTVDEIGPALKWATAEVTKAAKGNGGKPAASSGDYDYNA